MKLTEEQVASIKKHWGDWEWTHMIYDDLVKERLSELDKEFIEDLDKHMEGAKFWNA